MGGEVVGKWSFPHTFLSMGLGKCVKGREREREIERDRLINIGR